jgi:NAD(P)-dependent dehydrogenase (short-subunit alcohol dehydrogenase family)
MKLKDKVAVVTGAGAGIGRAIAARYAKEGAHVVIGEINTTTGRAAEEDICEKGGSALFIQTDMASEDQIKSMVAKSIDRFGRIDILVNNAAILSAHGEARAHELTNEVWERTISVNLRGYWLSSKYIIPIMLRQGRGAVIFLASPTGMFGFKRLTAYSTSKGGVIGLMRAMAVDYSADRIRVNAIVPGTMDTPMNAEELTNPEMRRKFVEMAPAGRLGVAEDVEGMAVFLASDESDYCVGGIYFVDGGLTAI